MMKIYTKTGDSGHTSLFGGTKISKDDARLEAYGTVDELNAFVGCLFDNVQTEEIKKELFVIQNHLFDIGSVLACDPEKNIQLKSISASDVAQLEKQIDEMDSHLSPLQNFILPSGHPCISATHVCRTVCRRAERRAVTLYNLVPFDNNIIIYLNRLSDYFFVLARYLAILTDTAEIKWQP
jgi:cob(I)alamin adenosyltransferase